MRLAIFNDAGNKVRWCPYYQSRHHETYYQHNMKLIMGCVELNKCTEKNMQCSICKQGVYIQYRSFHNQHSGGCPVYLPASLPEYFIERIYYMKQLKLCIENNEFAKKGKENDYLRRIVGFSEKWIQIQN